MFAWLDIKLMKEINSFIIIIIIPELRVKRVSPDVWIIP